MLHYGGFWRILRGYSYEVERILDTINFFPPVIIFLSVSGFLTAGSLDRCPDILIYFKKRIKRIFIPLWICTAVYFIVYLIIAREYMDTSILLWLVVSFFGIAYTPSCLKGFASGSANGVLWTITVLIGLYIITALLWKVIKKIRPVCMFCIVIPLFIGLNILSQYLTDNGLDDRAQKLLERSVIPFAIFFYIGVALYLIKDRAGKILPVIGLLAVVSLVIFHILRIPDYGYYSGIIRGLLTSVAAVCIGSFTPKGPEDGPAGRILSAIGRIDITYEIYLYQWLIINTLIISGVYAEYSWNTVLMIITVSTVLLAIFAYIINRVVTKVLKLENH